MELASFLADFENSPKNVQQQVLNYIAFLKNKYKKESSNKENKKGFDFNWKGGLSELKDEYISVELQHKINSLR